ncbi:rRNA maturation RNase YbeY [Arenibacterium sp. CAU 1754]
MPVELVIEDDRWSDLGLQDIADRSARATLDHLGVGDADFVLLACDDARIAVLNEDFREKPQATNVLSWPAAELAARSPGGRPEKPSPDFDGELALGDIAIAYDTCAREASEAGKPMRDHVTHLVIHGLLHLLGYDHVRDADATLMEGLEVAILGNLGVDNPYTDSDGP